MMLSLPNHFFPEIIGGQKSMALFSAGEVEGAGIACTGAQVPQGTDIFSPVLLTWNEI